MHTTNQTASSQIVRNFEESGFVVLPGLLPEAELALVSDEVNKILTGTTKFVPPDAIVYEPGSSPPQVRNVFHIHKYSSICMDLARHPAIIGIIGDILGRPLRLYSSSLFAKPAEVGTQVPLHQDMAYWPFEPYELLSCWIALDDSTIENGCVRFSVGSHNLGLLRHTPSGVPGNSMGVDDKRADGLPECAVEVRKGSCVLHHCLTAHRSEPNRSARPRRGLIFVYMSPQVRLTDPSKIKGEANFIVISDAVQQ